jgi:ankyrin repeat protein
VGNYRDNFGNSPIQEAIRLGRRACFLLCLHYEYLDSEAAHCCAVYNRAWELKVLHKLGIDVLWSRDSQHLTPLERAVENYSYDAAEYLTKLSGEFSMTDLAGRTDSKGILRLVKRIKK